jgi:hypothetical protein
VDYSSFCLLGLLAKCDDIKRNYLSVVKPANKKYAATFCFEQSMGLFGKPQQFPPLLSILHTDNYYKRATFYYYEDILMAYAFGENVIHAGDTIIEYARKETSDDFEANSGRIPECN